MLALKTGTTNSIEVPVPLDKGIGDGLGDCATGVKLIRCFDAADEKIHQAQAIAPHLNLDG